MSKKYRLKLNNKRIVGPFTKEQVGEMYLKGHLDGDEQCQIFPTGDWKSLQSHKELKELVVKIINREVGLEDLSSTQSEATIAKISLSQLKKSRDQKKEVSSKDTSSKEIKKEKVNSDFQEFQYDKETRTEISYDELEKKYNEENPTPVQTEKEVETKRTDGLEKTRVINRPTPQHIDKTIVVNPQVLKEEEKEEGEVSEEVEEVEEPKEPEIETDASTQFIDLNSIMPVVQNEIEEIEEELERQNEEDEEEIEEVEEKEVKKVKKKSKKKIKPIVALAFVVILGILFLDDDPKNKPINPQSVSIKLPTPAEFEEPEKAKEFLRLGIEAYKKGTYLSRVVAAANFKKSLEHQYRNNDARFHIIQSYAELYPDVYVDEKKQAAGKIYKLIQTARSKLLKDIKVALGSAIFYSHLGKHQTALYVVENYLRLSPPSKKLFAVYLDLLTKVGDLEKAKKALDTVMDIINAGEKKGTAVPIEAYMAVSKYHVLNEEFDMAEKIILQGLRRFGGSVQLLLEAAYFKLRNEDFKGLVTILRKVEELKAEQSPAYYAKYLEYTGILSAKQGDNKTAAGLFKIALKIHESDELRSKLAALELGGSATVEALIRESKVVDQMIRAKKALRLLEWEKAFNLALNAVDLNPSYIPSQLLLAKIQIQRGYFESALDTLRALKQEYPTNPKIYLALIEAYINASKLDEARAEITNMGQVGKGRDRLSETAEYASLQGKFYLKENNILLAAKWLIQSTNRNPLNDGDYFSLAQIYLTNRNYKKAKYMLSKALSLDPLNVEYHSSYAGILYELDSAEAAIGYLRNRLEESKDNPRLLGDIAKYYYRSGQMDKFEEYKKIVEGLHDTDTNFYQFLVKAAALEDKNDEVIKYSKKLITADPSNMEARMTLGQKLLSQGLYAEATAIFQSVLDRLKTYPKAHYFLAKIYMEEKKLKEALKEAELEIESNPKLYFGYYATGEVYRRMGKWAPAVKNLETAISINSKAVEALMSLGWINMRQNFMEKARERYLQAKRQEENNPEIRKQLGYIYQEIGQSALAVEELKTYLQLAPGAPDKQNVESLIRRLER